MHLSLEFDDFELLPSAGDSSQPFLLSDFDDGTSRTQTGGSRTYSWADAPDTAFEVVAPGRSGAGYSARIAGDLGGAGFSSWQARFAADNSPVDLSRPTASLNPDDRWLLEQTPRCADDEHVHRPAVRAAMSGDKAKIMNVRWDPKNA
jgi:hypothetical protein